jgi:hypothetical protein
MACKVIKDTFGTLYRIPEAKTVKTPGNKQLAGFPSVDVWWDRDMKDRADEQLLIRQENNDQRSDVISLTLAQVYDLIHALGWAVMKP